MLRLKYWIKDFFGFTRSQVNGFIILLILVTIMLFSAPVWHWWVSYHPSDFTEEHAILDSMVALWETNNSKNDGLILSKPDKGPFHFDPNKIPADQLVALGFSEQMATRIIRYREKGGKFRIKSDLLKIYGIDSTFYQHLYTFIRLPEKEKRFEPQKKNYPAKDVLNVKRVTEKFDLNTADTSQLKKIYGIGEKLSLRIIKYRDVLGGFVNMKQLAEVYGLDSMVVNRLTENATLQDGFRPTRINLNTSSEKQLSAHPYLAKIAKAIVSYRFQHGDFKKVEDIRNLGILDENTIEKITPYLVVN